VTKESLRGWLEIIGIFGVLASLIFVGIQLKQDRELSTVETLDGWMDQGSSLLELIASNSDVWHRACLGEELTDQERIVAQAISHSFFRYQFGRWVVSTIGTNQGARHGLVAANTVAMNLISFPALQEMLNSAFSRSAELRQSQPDWSDGFGALLSERMEVLTDLEPSRRLDVSLCGMPGN
jgi:hypothetical protein